MKSIKRNFFYNLIYQVLAILIPLITIPYASRKLGVEGIGAYSYTYSIVYYFMIISMLGLNTYGSRIIASKQGDKDDISKLFGEIYGMQLIVSFIVLVVYIIFVFLFGFNYKQLFLIQIMYILSSMIDINWFYHGSENFKLTVIRNSIIKVLSFFLIILLVQEASDVWKYTAILSASTFISNIYLIFNIKKYVKFSYTSIKDSFKHFIPCLLLFIPVVAMKIYKVMDKTMIGLLSTITEVGYYSNADSIINVPMGIIIALGTVMLPRMTHYISTNNKKKAENYFNQSLKFALFIIIPIMFGLITIGKKFAILFLGEEFAKTGTIIQILAVTTVFMTISNVIRTQYLIPNNKDKEYIISIIIGAIINLISNLIFIKKFGAFGACIGTIFAEFTVMFFHIYFAQKYIDVLRILKNNLPLLIKGTIMLLIVYPIDFLKVNNYLIILIQVVLGCLIYFTLNIGYLKRLKTT